MIGLLAMQDDIGYAEWSNQSNIHPISLAAMAVLGLTTLVIRREYVIWPIALICGFITVGQRFVVADLDFPVTRILVMFGWTRLLLRREYIGFRLMPLDRVMLAWAVSTCVANVMLVVTQYPHLIQGTIIYRLGWSFDNLGVYFLFRLYIRNWQDLKNYILAFAVVALPCAVFFAVEKATGRNLFAVLGGVNEITVIRNGRLRCQGSFQHPIYAGVFYAGLMPLFFGCFLGSAAVIRALMLAAIFSGLVIVFACSSSTPVMAVVFTVGGICFYLFRSYTKILGYGVLCMLVVLHFTMEAPVWHLLSRIDLAGGSTGWHRFFLVDNFIRYFNDWALFGVLSTHYWGYQQFDVTNFYVLQGVKGGLLTLILFMVIVFLSFRSAYRLTRLLKPGSMHYWFAWLLGVALFVHCLNMIAVSYFLKILLLLNLQLATLTSLEQHERAKFHALQPQPVPDPATEPPTDPQGETLPARV